MAKFLYEKDGQKVYGVDLEAIETKSVGDYELEIVGSTPAVDRDGEVIDVNGWQLKNYKKNPVVLPAHDYRQPAIGRAKSVRVKDGKLIFKIEFPPEGVNPLADIYRKLYKLGFMKASSVGFIPLEWKDGDPQKGIRRIYTKTELLELSLVSVPANPEALAVDKGIMKAKEEGVLSEDEIKMLEDVLKEIRCEEEGICDAEGQDIDDVEAKGVVPYKREPLADRNRGWDGTGARRRLAIWAGGPDKDKMNWGKYKRGFAYVMTGEEENFGGYKLPHHDVIDGGIKTVWRGVVAAMAALLGARGGVDIPSADKKRVYSHLAKHYADFGEEPPEFKEYVLDELKEIFGEEVLKMAGYKLEDEGYYKEALFGVLDELKSEETSKRSVELVKSVLNELKQEV